MRAIRQAAVAMLADRVDSDLEYGDIILAVEHQPRLSRKDRMDGLSRRPPDTQTGQRLAVTGAQVWLWAVLFASTLICLPGLRDIAGHGDEGILLHGAQRILDGEWPYRDFFEFIPPLGFVLTAGWLAVTDGSFLATRLLVLLQVITVAALIYLTCLRVSGRSVPSAAVAVAWVFALKLSWFQTSHHLFTTMFSTLALWALLKWLDMRPRNNWLVLLAGLAGGSAAMCTSTRGALVLLAGLAAFALVRNWRAAIAVYCLAALVVPALLLADLGARGALIAAYEDVVLYPTLHYADIQAVPYGFGAYFGNAGVVLVFPLAGALLCIDVVSDWRRSLRDPVLHLSAAFALAAFLGHLVRTSVPLIALSMPLALPLILRCSTRFSGQIRFFLRPGLLVYVITAGLLIPAYVLVCLLQYGLRNPLAHTARGVVAVTGYEARSQGILELIKTLPAGENVFFYPYSPLLPFLTDRRHPSSIDVFIPGFTTPEHYAAACQEAMRRADWVVRDRGWTAKAWLGTHPAMKTPDAPERLAMERALETGFVHVVTDGSYELRRRAPQAHEQACESILR